jgi:hypothetical protein
MDTLEDVLHDFVHVDREHDTLAQLVLIEEWKRDCDFR